jgi:serine/threonine protein kinase/outer membrane protein assembly factor BamB
MGAVYAGVQEDLHRRVALKVLLGSKRIADADLARFRQEALAAAELGHPNIVQVSDFQAWPNEPPILVMEMLDGESLRSLLTREPRLAPGRAAFIATQILAALGAAHAAGIVHRDIKPPNVFLTRTPAMSDLVKVLDFGVAKVPRPSEGFTTDPGEVLGTPAYMAPEQALGLEIDHRIDLYAVGVCLFEMLAGRRPFVASTPGEMLGMITSSPSPPLRSVAPDVDPKLAAVVDSALHRDPLGRPASALAMLELLAPWSRTDSTISSLPDIAVVGRAPGTALMPAMNAVRTTPDPNVATIGPSVAPHTTNPSRAPYAYGPPSFHPHPSSPSMSLSLPRPPTTQPLPPKSNAALFVALAVLAAVVPMLGMAVYTVSRYVALARAVGTSPVLPSPTDVPSNPMLSPDYWIVQSTQRPVVGDFVGDGTLDIGLHIRFLQASTTHLAIFDGKSNTLMWKSAPLGDDVHGPRATVAVGKRIALVASDSLVRIYDATNGRELRSVSTTDAIRQICRPASPLGDKSVWIETFEYGLLLDVETGVLTKAKIPQGCWSKDVMVRFRAVEGVAPEIELRVPEGKISALAEGTYGVGQLQDSVNTRPVVGVSLESGKILWRLPGNKESSWSPVIDVVDRRAYIGRATKTGSSVECVDVRTGSIVWSVDLGKEELTVSSVVVAGGRAYLNTYEGVFVVDAAKGQIVSRVRYAK